MTLEKQIAARYLIDKLIEDLKHLGFSTEEEEEACDDCDCDCDEEDGDDSIDLEAFIKKQDVFNNYFHRKIVETLEKYDGLNSRFETLKSYTLKQVERIDEIDKKLKGLSQ